MEDLHYCLKCGSTLLGLENYINHRKMPCENVTSSKIYEEAMSCDVSKIERDGTSTAKPDEHNRDSVSEMNKKKDKVEADDFFSSLELQSSSKTMSNMGNISIAGKSSGGIVTRSKSLLSYPDLPKYSEKVNLNGTKTRTIRKKAKKQRVLNMRKKASNKKFEGKDKKEAVKKQSSGVTRVEDSSGTSPGLDRAKEDDEWSSFNNLIIRKDLDERRMEAPGSIRRYTPELFSMGPILITDDLSEDKDVEVDKFLENEDYDDVTYLNLEDVDEFNYAPPRCHTGGKWKPGSFIARASPILWTSQPWDNLLDEDGRNSSIELPAELDRCKALLPVTGCKWKSYNPPNTYTGGKWKPSELTPVKKQQEIPPATYTGGKWHPGKQITSEPPATHTGGKWKPQISPDQLCNTWKSEPDLTPSKSSVDKTFNVIASCQSTSGKCLKTAGGLIQYYCSPCNRRLSSKKMYKKHVLSELHLKRVLQENELEFDSRSIKIFRGLYSVMHNNKRGLGKREIKKPEFFNDMEMGTGKRMPKDLKSDKLKRKRLPRKELIRCDICKIKLASHQLGKHLVSYYHSRRIRLDDPEQQKLVLDNIHVIVKQAPYQCGICKFYFNTHKLFKQHWISREHKMEEMAGAKFWCILCNFECDTSRLMELHLDSNSHREVIMAVNKSIPIIIRQKQTVNCKFCDKKFRYNFALMQHNRISHGLSEIENHKIYPCLNCKYKAKTVKSLQRHVLRRHKTNGKVPYFCSACEMYFPTAEDARNHRKSQTHRSNRKKKENPSIRSCPHCPKDLEDLDKLKVHISENHSALRPKCSKCGMIFTLSREVTQHTKTCTFSYTSNQIAETYNCSTCAYSAALKSDILYHELLHDKQEGDIRSCPICCKSYRIFALKVHLRTHTGERPYSCQTCSKTFIRKTRLLAHLKFDHIEENEEEERKKPVDGPKCGDPKCKYVTTDVKDMEYHLRVHIGWKVFQCPVCPYRAKTNTLLKRHNKIHLDERSYPCPHCPFRGRLASNLKRHLRLHTGAKPYTCPHCPYQCNNLENLRKHVLYTKIHRGKKLYECKMCAYSTNASKIFKQHLFSKHGDRFRTEVAITAYMAGIYNVEEDMKTAVNPVPIKLKTISTPTKADKSMVLKNIAILTKKYEPIAPKTGSKTTGNSLQDKRKVLEMELEKLKNQVKKKPVKSYPSPTILRELRAKVMAKSPDNVATKKEQSSHLTPAINQTESQSEDPSPTYILYESGISFEDNEDHLTEQEFYLLENYND